MRRQLRSPLLLLGGAVSVASTLARAIAVVAILLRVISARRPL